MRAQIRSLLSASKEELIFDSLMKGDLAGTFWLQKDSQVVFKPFQAEALTRNNASKKLSKLQKFCDQENASFVNMSDEFLNQRAHWCSTEKHRRVSKTIFTTSFVRNSMRRSVSCLRPSQHQCPRQKIIYA